MSFFYKHPCFIHIAPFKSMWKQEYKYYAEAIIYFAAQNYPRSN